MKDVQGLATAAGRQYLVSVSTKKFFVEVENQLSIIDA